VVEGLASKKPVIASNIGGIPEIIGDGSGILIAPNSDIDCANAIMALKNNPEYYKVIADAGYKRLSNFTIQHMVGGIETVYYNVLKNKRLA
jgi:glycosyltransferase involved in cell wall biosynthesis